MHSGAAMKSTPPKDVHDLPLPELRQRVERACLLLREAALHPAQGGPATTPLAAIAAVRHLLPGFTDPPRSLLACAIRALGLPERQALRDAIAAESAARDRLARMLGPVAPVEAWDVLTRLEVLDAAAIAMSALVKSANTQGRGAGHPGAPS